MTLRRRVITFGYAVVIIYLIAFVLESCDTSMDQKTDKKAEGKETTISYVGSSTCQSCHAREFSDWKKSDHFLAMQLPNDSSVLGDFNNSTFTAEVSPVNFLSGMENSISTLRVKTEKITTSRCYIPLGISRFSNT